MAHGLTPAERFLHACEAATGEHYGRVPSTGELIGPYDTADELAREIAESEREALADRYDGLIEPCPICGALSCPRHMDEREALADDPRTWDGEPLYSPSTIAESREARA